MTLGKPATGASSPSLSSGTAALTIECVHDRETLHALAPAWQRLLDDSALKSVFLTWEWQRAWLDHYLVPGDEPWVLVLREGGHIVGIAPFLRQIETRHGRPAIRRLRFLGTGEPEAEEVVSEAMDIISLPGQEAKAATIVARYLMEHSPEWDVLYFQDIRHDSLIRQLLLPLLQQEGWKATETAEWANYSVILPATLMEYIARHPKKRRYQFNRGLRELREQRGEFKVLTDAAEIDHYLDEWKRLHEIRWQSHGKPGIFATPRVQAFHAQVMRDMLAVGRLEFSLLSFDGRAVSANYSLGYKKSWQYYQTGFDPGYTGVHSVGMMHLLQCFQRHLDAGGQEFDFLKSDTTDISYKTTYGCVATPIYDLTIYGRGLRARLLWLEKSARLGARRIRDLLRRRRGTSQAASTTDEQ